MRIIEAYAVCVRLIDDVHGPAARRARPTIYFFCVPPPSPQKKKITVLNSRTAPTTGASAGPNAPGVIVHIAPQCPAQSRTPRWDCALSNVLAVPRQLRGDAFAA